jgi:hypothetical protein
MRFCVQVKNKPCKRRIGFMRLIPWIHPRGSGTLPYRFFVSGSQKARCLDPSYIIKSFTSIIGSIISMINILSSFMKLYVISRNPQLITELKKGMHHEIQQGSKVVLTDKFSSKDMSA